jgi:hypothetical protein
VNIRFSVRISDMAIVRLQLIATSILATILVSACSSKQDASASTFEPVVTEVLASHQEECRLIAFDNWPETPIAGHPDTPSCLP